MLSTRRTAVALAATSLISAICLAASRPATATEAAQSPITIVHPWARPTPGGATTGVTYMTLTARGQADRLVGISTPVAAAADLHETIDDKGVMKMRSVDGLALADGQPVALKPGGYHIMLMGLKKPLKTGESFPMTLTFQHAGPVTVTVPVATISGAMPHGMDMSGGHPMTGGSAAAMPGMKQ